MDVAEIDRDQHFVNCRLNLSEVVTQYVIFFMTPIGEKKRNAVN